jgi:hypothetical protein
MQNAINIDKATRVIWFPLDLQIQKGFTAKDAKDMRLTTEH